MKKFTIYLSAVLTALFLVSCEEKNSTVIEDPADVVFELNSEELSVSVAGGQASMQYVLENPVDTASVHASSGAEWLSGFVDNGHEVMFRVAPNDGEDAREAEVTVTYIDLIRYFTVRQDGTGPNPTGINITVKEVGISDVVYDVIPNDKSMTYVYGVIDKDYWDDLTPEDTPEAFMEDEMGWYQFQAEWQGMTLSQFLSQVTVTGDRTDQKKDGLTADMEHVVYAFGVNTDVVFTSDLYYEYFKTEDIVPSDNQIGLSISNVTATSADIKITVTNDDEYIYGADLASNWTGMSDDEILARLLSDDYDLSGNIRSGEYEATFWSLQPETEYIVFVFGYQAGKNTTDLISKTFTTSEMTYADDVTFSIEIGSLFDVDEVLALYPEMQPFFGDYAAGRVYCLMTPVISETAAGCYWMYYGWMDMMDPNEYSDAMLIEELSYVGYWYEDGAVSNFLDYGKIGTVVGVSYDENYEYGPVYRKLIEFTEEDITPASEFPIEDYMEYAPSVTGNRSRISPAVDAYVTRVPVGFKKAVNTRTR